MPSDELRSWYEDLLDITLKTKNAVMEGDLEETEHLLQMHQELMGRIKASGDEPGPELTDLIKTLNHEVQVTSAEIEKQKRSVLKALSSEANRKKITNAYGK